MAVSSTTYLLSYNGNGSTVAFVTPYFLVNADIKAVLIAADLSETTLVNPTHFSVTGAGTEAGGTLTMVTAPASGEKLIVYRDPAQTQPVNLITNDPFPSDTVEDELDKLTMLTQRLAGRIDKSIRVKEWDVSGASFVIPTPSASKFLRWNSAASAIEYADISFESTGLTVSATVADLRTVTGTVQHEMAVVLGSSAVGDGGGSNYFWDATSSATDNGTTVVKPTAVSGAGRWLRQTMNGVSFSGSAGALSILSNGDVSVKGHFRKATDSAFFNIAGGDDFDKGGSISLYGSTHATLANSVRIRLNGADKFIMAPTGAFTFNAPSGAETVTISGSANQWTARIAASAASGQSYGLVVNAGTDVNDVGFAVTDASNVTSYFKVLGNGSVIAGNSSAVGNGSNNVFSFDTAALYCRLSRSGTSALNQMTFLNPNGTVGSISTSGTSTSFNTTSDYRLKTVVDDNFKALALINSIAIKEYYFKKDEDKENHVGVLAHELQALIPTAVIGPKDAVDGDGNIQPQGVDYSKLVPYLISAVQEISTDVSLLKQNAGLV